MKNRILRFSTVLLFTFLFSFSFNMFVNAADTMGTKTTIKVAFYELDNFFEYDENGNPCGYGVDYLNELKKYANIEWEYVPVDSWEGIKEKMLNGEVDVRMPVSEPTKPSELYDYTIEPMLTSYHAIMTLKSKENLYYQDYPGIAHLKIAACSNLLDKTGVGSYLDAIGVTDNLIFYPDYNSCRAALDTGEVDALISNVMDLTDEMKILDKFSVVDNYITTLKENPCYTIINDAMTQLKLENPSFQTSLYQKYFPERVNEPFTKEESEYIAATDSITVAVYPDRKPVSYLKEDGSYGGIAIDMADLLSEKIGIPFTYVSITTDTQPEMLQTADLVMPVPQLIDAPNCFTTQSILDLEILMAVQNSSTELTEGARVGVLSNTPGILKTIQNLNCFDIQLYDNNRDAFNALQRGEIDAFANSSFVINWMLQNPRYSNLETLRYQSFPLAYAICGKKEDKELQSILTKVIHTIDNEQKTEIIQNGTKLMMDDFTLIDRLYVYRIPINCILTALILITILTLLYIRSRGRYIQQIEESVRKQEKASLAKSEFLSRMSHDMRTPLNVIMGMSRLAKDNDNPADTDSCLDKINISSEFLLGLINDVLDMEHIESGKIVLHPVPYSGLEFRKYIDAVISPLCEQKNVHFQYSYDGITDFTVMQDKLRINQVYFNLLSNAVKFTPEGGSVSFHSNIEETDHNTIFMDVTIADTGIGMKPEFAAHMFEPFTQENQVFKSISEGSGLGLYIVKRICDLMNMSIEVHSEPGHGTTFHLQGEYPVAIDTKEEPKDRQQPISEDFLANKTILVCEDHPLNQEIIRRLLEKKNAIVVVAENGKSGVELFEQSIPGDFAMILMDIRMPVMDGIQAAKQIRASSRMDAGTIPIIALTANAYDEDVKHCKEAGMNGHLAKPIEPEALYQIMANCLNE